MMPQIEPLGRVCCLLGDVSTIPKRAAYDELLKQLSPQFEHVLVILGNHEFYHDTFTTAKTFWHHYFESVVPNELQLHNVVLLDCQTFDVDNVRFVGATLWSHMYMEAFEKCQLAISDFKHILSDDPSQVRSNGKREGFSPNVRNQLHQEQLKWIENQLEKAKLDQKRVVLLTHHAPTKNSVDTGRYQTDPVYSQTYSTETLKGKIQDSFGDIIEYWCFGHTHDNVNFTLKSESLPNTHNIRIVTNQLGSYMKGQRIDFNPSLLLHM